MILGGKIYAEIIWSFFPVKCLRWVRWNWTELSAFSRTVGLLNCLLNCLVGTRKILNFCFPRKPWFAYFSFFTNVQNNEREHYNGFENAVGVNLVIVSVSIDDTYKHFKPWHVLNDLEYRLTGPFWTMSQEPWHLQRGETQCWTSPVILVNYREVHTSASWMTDYQNSGGLQPSREIIIFLQMNYYILFINFKKYNK